MDYDKMCCMHRSLEMVHNFLKVKGVKNFCALCIK